MMVDSHPRFFNLRFLFDLILGEGLSGRESMGGDVSYVSYVIYVSYGYYGRKEKTPVPSPEFFYHKSI